MIELRFDGYEYQLYTEEEKVQAVRDIVEESIQYFDRGFLENLVDQDVLKDIHTEFVENYVEGIKHEGGRIEKEMEEINVDNEDDFIEALVNEKVKEGLFYFIDNFGDEEGINIVIKAEGLDLDEVTEEAIDIDGAGHFLNPYNGEEHEVEIDGEEYFAYRIN